MKRGMEFITLLAEFFDSYLPDTKGVSENTIRSYKAALRLFFTFLEEEKGIHPEKVTFSILDSGMIDEFLSWLENTRGCSKQTRNQRLAALSSFAKFAMRRCLLERFPPVFWEPKERECRKETVMMLYSSCQKKCESCCRCQTDKQFVAGEMLS